MTSNPDLHTHYKLPVMPLQVDESIRGLQDSLSDMGLAAREHPKLELLRLQEARLCDGVVTPKRFNDELEQLVADLDLQERELDVLSARVFYVTKKYRALSLNLVADRELVSARQDLIQFALRSAGLDGLPKNAKQFRFSLVLGRFMPGSPAMHDLIEVIDNNVPKAASLGRLAIQS